MMEYKLTHVSKRGPREISHYSKSSNGWVGNHSQSVPVKFQASIDRGLLFEYGYFKKWTCLLYGIIQTDFMQIFVKTRITLHDPR